MKLDKARWFLQSMRPKYHLQSDRIDKDWDREINSLLDDGHCFGAIGDHTAHLGPHKVWIANHPYASFECQDSPRFGRVRPRRRTIVRAWEQLQKDRKKLPLPLSAPSTGFGYIARYNNALTAAGLQMMSQQQANAMLGMQNMTSQGLLGYLSYATQNGEEKLAERISCLREVEAAHVTPPMPDHVATLTGWRGWRVNKDGLLALGQGTAWEPKKAAAATCIHNSDGHNAPVNDCSCGYWSFKSMDLLQEALKPYADSVVVVGPVDIWGKVIECENGFRSEFAYPKELWLLKPDLDFLSWTYGVPVRKADVQKMDKDSSVTPA